MRRVFALLAAAVAALLVGVVLPAGPALAYPDAWHCEDGQGGAAYRAICFYDKGKQFLGSDPHPSESWGDLVQYDVCINTYGHAFIPATTSYIRNHSPYRWYASAGNYCDGEFAPIYPNSEGNMSAHWNDHIRSLWRANQTTKQAGPVVLPPGAWLSADPVMTP